MPLESQLAEFVEIVEAGSVAGAARVLDVPRASVSRRLAKLEERYGVQLLHRQPPLRLTEAGSELYQRARKIVGELEEAHRAVSALDAVPRGLLRVGMPAASGIEMLLASAMLERHPEVSLEFIATPTHDDLLGNRLDIALRAGEIRDEGLMSRKLVTFNNYIYGAPSLLERLGTPTLETLPQFPCMLGFDSEGRPQSEWPLWSGGTVNVSGPIRANTFQSQFDGAKLGLGLTLCSERLARSAVRSGELMPLLQDEVGHRMSVRLVWPAMEFMPPKVRAFIDLAAEVIGEVVSARDREPA